VDFVDDPEETVHLDRAAGREGAEVMVSRQQDTPRVLLRQSEREAVVDGEPRCFPNHLPRAKNPLAGQVHDFEPAAKEDPLLSDREFQELVFEEGVRYQDLVREL
jgi:hypothetical protein